MRMIIVGYCLYCFKWDLKVIILEFCLFFVWDLDYGGFYEGIILGVLL